MNLSLTPFPAPSIRHSSAASCGGQLLHGQDLVTQQLLGGLFRDNQLGIMDESLVCVLHLLRHCDLQCSDERSRYGAGSQRVELVWLPGYLQLNQLPEDFRMRR